MRKIASDYIKNFNEFFPLIKLFFIKKLDFVNSKKVLIVNNCLIGDFVVSIPAIRDYIIKNQVEVDMIVSPIVKNLAKRIKGVKNVYVAKTSQNRNLEDIYLKNSEKLFLNNYKEMVVIRINSESYSLIKNIHVKSIRTPLIPIFSFVFDIVISNILRRTPKRWQETCYEILNVNDTNLNFENKIKLDSKEEKILIHTDTNLWFNQYDNNKWIKVLKKINKLGDYRFIFIGGMEIGNDNFNIISNSINLKVYSLINKISLEELLLLMIKSDYFIGIDSGPRNMAQLVDLRTLTLLGPGPHNFNSKNKKDVIIDKSKGKGIYQKMFSDIKLDTYINKISPEEVVEGFKTLVKNANSK